MSLGPPSNEKLVLARVRRIENAIAKAKEYLQSGKHARWRGFRAWFSQKTNKDGREPPPHRDWVKHVFLRRMEKALARAERVLEDLPRRRKRGPRGRAGRFQE